MASLRTLPVCCLLLAIASMLTGCPTPTGRHRGRVATDAFCTGTEMPHDLTACSVEGDFCPFQRTCNGTGFQNINCTCTSGLWRCTPGPCEMPVTDAEFTGCPATVRHGDSCSPRQGGLYCAGTLNCGGVDESASCWCTGSAWTCSAPGCVDAGPDGSDAGDVMDVAIDAITDATPDVTTLCSADAGPCDPGTECLSPAGGGCWQVCSCGVGSVLTCDPPTCSGDAALE